MNEKQFNIFYFIGLIVTTFLMLLILLIGDKSFNVTFLVFFWVIKFLSGFGLVLSIVNGFFLLLNKTKDRISEKGTKILIVIQIVIPLLLIIYAVYKIYASYAGPSSAISMSGIWKDIYVWIDNIIYIYGILSLLLNLYILPLIRGDFDEAINLGRQQKMGKSLKQFGRSIKKKWFNWRDEFAKAKFQDQKIIKELLVNWRNKFAVILLIPLAIGAFIFMPIAFIFIVMWLKIIIFDRTTINKYEKIALLISIIIVGALAIIIPFFELEIYSQISNWLWTINIFYLIGIVIATLLFMTKLLSLQGITMRSIKKQRFEKKKDNLEVEKKRLKAEREELERIKKEINSK
ncbi:MAG: hypothetical protein ACTSRI_06650 [Promethearchaeota archaeon]